MKRAFTLIELMTVVGIMSFLGVAATGGYNALQRGMAERSATDTASKLLSAAKERAIVDRVPTVVFCYNRLVREADADNNAIVVGEMVAIRRAGRISKVRGKYLYDEFGDLDRSYDSLDSSQEGQLQDRKGLALWWFGDSQTSMSSMRYSLVADGVYDDDDIAGYTYATWADGSQQSSNLTIRAWAFYDLGTSTHQPNWVVGNGYGLEFQRVQLPNNFIFNTTVPSQVGAISAETGFYFDPEKPVDRAIDVYFCRMDSSGKPVPNGQKAGTARSDGGVS